MSEIRLILSFTVSGRDWLMMVLCIYTRAIKRSSINCRAQNVLLTCTFPARKRCKNTFRSVTCMVGDGWVRGGRSAPGQPLQVGPSPTRTEPRSLGGLRWERPGTRGGLGLCPNYPGRHWSIAHGAGSQAPAGPCGAADPGTGHPLPAACAGGAHPAPLGRVCRWVCKARVLKLIKY